MPETSIVIKVEDSYSSALKNLSNAMKSFDKTTEALERRLHDLSGEKSVLKAETDKARKAMQDAQKQFASTGDAADALAASLAGQEYEDYRRKMDAINKTMRETEKEIHVLEGVSRKSGGSVGSGIGTLVGALAANGIGDMLSSLAQEGANTIASSIGGAEIGTYFSSALSSAISGAAIGSTIAPGIGTAIGAGLGALAGVASGGIQNFQSKNDSFKEYYKGLYETVSEATEEGLTSGKELAASRETDRLAFATLLGGNEQADSFLSEVIRTADTTPFQYDDLTGLSKTLLSFGYAVEDIIPTMTKVGDAGAALGLSTSDIGTVATYIGRMKSSDKASLEYLNPLMERGFAVFEWLAEDRGVSQKKIYEMISKGTLTGSKASDVILRKFKELYSGQMEKQSKTTEGLDSTLEGTMENIEAAGGEAYNALRNLGKEADIKAYGGELGEAMKGLNEVVGENRAYGENLSAQYTREALEAVLLGKETTLDFGGKANELATLAAEYKAESDRYAEARDSGNTEEQREAGLAMERIYESTEALATASYESSEWYQTTMDAELKEITTIRENTDGLVAAMNTYILNNAFTKGQGGVDLQTGPLVGDTDGNRYISRAEATAYANSLGYSNAYGLRRVPFNGYPAVLHQDERVLTAAEARERDGGSGLVVNFTGPITVRQDSDLEELASRLADELDQARERAG